MTEHKAEPVEIILKEEKIRKYFPESYTTKQMEQTINQLLKNWHRKRQTEHER